MQGEKEGHSQNYVLFSKLTLCVAMVYFKYCCF